MTEAGHVLKPGDVVNYNGILFQVDRVERRRVISVKLELPAAAATAVSKASTDTARAAG
jgi:CBS domain containing-hemolysin-like protein